MRNPALPFLAAVLAAGGTPTPTPDDPTITITSPVAGQSFEVGALPVSLAIAHAGWDPAGLEAQVSLDAFATSSTATYVSGNTWTGSLTTTAESSYIVSARVRVGSGSWIAATGVNVSTAPTYVPMVVTGATFAPAITRAPGSTAVARWYCVETDTELTGDAPTFSFGSAEVRHVYLYVERGVIDARADVRTLNFGFDNNNDQGRYQAGAAYNRTAQAITGISYVNTLTGLTHFMAHNTPLTGELDFTGCSTLQYLELYGADVTGLVLTGCTSLIRLCIEACSVSYLDLNPVAGCLYDLRAAIQTNGISFATMLNPLVHLYHYCVRDQRVVNSIAANMMPALEERWAWYTQQTGPLVTPAPLVSLQVRGNAWSSVDISASTGAYDIDLRSCSLSTAMVDSILAQANAWGTSTLVLQLTGNSGPSVTGAGYAAAMRARGCTVDVEATVGGGDTTAPVNTVFTMPATATSSSVSVTAWTATDAVGVVGWIITTDTEEAPAANNAAITGSAWTQVTGLSEGTHTFRCYTFDAVGNRSLPLTQTTTVTLIPVGDPPTISAFTIPATAQSLSGIAVGTLTATNTPTEWASVVQLSSAAAPSTPTTGWGAQPTSFTAPGAASGFFTVYVWARNATGTSAVAAAEVLVLLGNAASVTLVSKTSNSAAVVTVSYDFETAGQLNDWVAQGGSTIAITGGALTSTGGNSDTLRGIRWTRQMQATSVVYRCRSSENTLGNIMLGHVVGYNGTPYNPNPGVMLAKHIFSPNFEIDVNGSDSTGGSGYTSSANTYYDFTVTLSTTSATIATASPAGSYTRTAGAPFTALGSIGYISFGHYQANGAWDSIALTGTVAV